MPLAFPRNCDSEKSCSFPLSPSFWFLSMHFWAQQRPTHVGCLFSLCCVFFNTFKRHDTLKERKNHWMSYDAMPRGSFISASLSSKLKTSMFSANRDCELAYQKAKESRGDFVNSILIQTCKKTQPWGSV